MTNDLPIDSSMIDRWTNQWIRQLGFNDEQLIKRNHKVEQFSRFVLDRIKAKKTADISKREKLLVETLREYEHRLSRTGFENDIDEDFESMKLKQKEIFIEKKHQELDMKEEKSIKDLDQLSQKERKLCEILTANALDLIPDETLIKRIERLRDYLETLENLKNERLTTVKSHRTRVNTLSSQLDSNRDDVCPIVSALLEEKYESCLTNEALLRIETLIDDLQTKVKEQENRINTLVHHLEKLYTKLSRDDASPPKRSAAYILRKNNAETVKQLEDEIAQLQAKRMATSQAYCESMKKKIEELYELCQIGPSERHPVDFDNITPDTLDECDREYDRLDDLYRVRKPVLEAYDQWKILVQQHAEFQKKSTSAARFHERGYSAVKEQAERKRFAVAVPKAERNCLIALEQWEKDHLNEQFLINDVPLRQMIDQSQNTTTNTTTTKSVTAASAIGTTAVPQRTLAKTNNRKKSLRQIVKATVEHHVSKIHHEEEAEAEDDTFEFTHIENVKHFNGLPRVVTSTPKTGKTNQSHTVVDTGRNKTNDPIQKRRPSKRLIPSRR